MLGNQESIKFREIIFASSLDVLSLTGVERDVMHHTVFPGLLHWALNITSAPFLPYFLHIGWSKFF